MIPFNRKIRLFIGTFFCKHVLAHSRIECNGVRRLNTLPNRSTICTETSPLEPSDYQLIHTPNGTQKIPPWLLSPVNKRLRRHPLLERSAGAAIQFGPLGAGLYSGRNPSEEKKGPFNLACEEETLTFRPGKRNSGKFPA